MLRIQALTLAIFFTWTTIAAGPSFLFAQTIHMEPSGKREGIPTESFFPEIPPELGTVEEYYAPSTMHQAAGKSTARGSKHLAPFMIHIQDAHANPAIQKKIQEILEYLSQRQAPSSKHPETNPFMAHGSGGRGPLLVVIEGSAGPLHPEYLNFFQDKPELNEAIVQDLASKGELSGVEQFAWKRYSLGAWSMMHGAEDIALYRENLSAYRELLFKQGEIERFLLEFRKPLDFVKSRVLSPDLRKFLHERERRKEGNYSSGVGSPDLAGYLSFLRSEAKEKLGIDLETPFEQVRFPHLVRIFVIQRSENKIDLKKSGEEEKKLIEILKTKARTEEEKTLVEALSRFSKLPYPRHLAEKVWEFSERRQISLENYPEYLKAMGLAILRSELDAVKLFEEMEILEEWLIEKLAQRDGERRLLEIMNDFSLLKNLLNLSLTRKEHERILRAPEKIDPESILKRLSLLNKTPSPSSSFRGRGRGQGEEIEKFITAALHFYSGAGQRDQVILENALQTARENRASRVVLVTGGFHTPGLTELMKNRGIGYAVIRPAFQKEGRQARDPDFENLYAKVLRDEHALLLNKQTSLTKQEALFLKSLLETAAPILWEKYGLSLSEIASQIVKVVKNHPVLSQRIQAEASESWVRLVINQEKREARNFPSPRLRGEGQGEGNAVSETAPLSDPRVYSIMRPPPGDLPRIFEVELALIGEELVVQEVRAEIRTEKDPSSDLESELPALAEAVHLSVKEPLFEPSDSYSEEARRKIKAIEKSLNRLDKLLKPYRAEVRATEAEIEKGVKYFLGEIRTGPVRVPFRPSRLGDFKFIPDLSQAERQRYISLALASLARGEGVFATAAAGAAARMNVKEAPPEVKEMAKKVHGEGHELESKAAVPVGSYGGRVYTYLGLLLANIARLQQLIEEALPRAKRNEILIMTNASYQEELTHEIKRQNFYGLDPDQFLRHEGRLGFQQDLGVKYFTHREDTEKVHKSLSEKVTSQKEREEIESRYAQSLQRSQEINEKIRMGEKEAVVHPTEKDPLGHGEFFHQLVSKGILLDLIEKGKRWISFRNIDNAAATYTEDWLVSLGIFLDEGLDMQPEASIRIPGQKGGGLIITQEGNHQLTEDPSFEATVKEFLKEKEKRGSKRLLEEGKLPGRVVDLLRQKIQEGQPVILEPSRMSFEREEISDLKILDQLIQENRIAVFEKEGNLHIYRIVTSADSVGFNDAVAIFSPHYILDIYRREGQSREALIEEMKKAKAEGALEAIAERGRRKFPMLVDPKPARDPKILSLVKIETNMWQSTGVVPKETKIKAVGVSGIAGIKREDYLNLSSEEQDERMSHVRMLATKQWEGATESYKSNAPFMAAIFRQVFEKPLFPPDLLLVFRHNRHVDEIREVVRKDLDSFVETTNRLVEEEKVRGIGKLVFEATKDDPELREKVSKYYEALKSTLQDERGRIPRQALENIGIGEVVFIAPEMEGVSFAGGLAKVIRHLPEALSQSQIPVTVITPLYENEHPKGYHPSAVALLKEGIVLNGKKIIPEKVGEAAIPIGPVYLSAQRYQQVIPDDPQYHFKTMKGDIYLAKEGDLRVYLIGGLDQLYPNVDSDGKIQRAIFFSRAALEVIRTQDIYPHILSVHEWPTAPIIPLLMIESGYQTDQHFRDTKFLPLIHNNGHAYQGRFYTNPAVEINGQKTYIDLYPRFNLHQKPGEDHYPWTTHPGNHEMMNLSAWTYRHLIANIHRAAATAVSKPYAEEIETNSEYGADLQGLLSSIAEGGRLFGISNGIEDSVRERLWKEGETAIKSKGLPPISEQFNSEKYSASVSGYKKAAKPVVQKKYGLHEEKGTILISLVGRLTEQKGIQLLTAEVADEVTGGKMTVLEKILREDPKVQILLGGPLALEEVVDRETGKKTFAGDEAALRLKEVAEELHRKPEFQGRLAMGSSEEFAKKQKKKRGEIFGFIAPEEILEIMLASDFFLMPSRFEPGGITQLEALAAGTAVIAHNVGGIKGTLTQFDAVAKKGDAFLFEGFNANRFLEAVRRAIQTIQVPEQREKIILNAISAPHNWEDRVSSYRVLFQFLAGALLDSSNQPLYPHLAPSLKVLDEIQVKPPVKRSELRLVGGEDGGEGVDIDALLQKIFAPMETPVAEVRLKRALNEVGNPGVFRPDEWRVAILVSQKISYGVYGKPLVAVIVILQAGAYGGDGWEAEEKTILGNSYSLVEPGAFPLEVIVRMDALPEVTKAWNVVLKYFSQARGRIRLHIEVEGSNPVEARRAELRFLEEAKKLGLTVRDEDLNFYPVRGRGLHAYSRRIIASRKQPVGLISSDSGHLDQYTPWLLRVQVSRQMDLDSLAATILIVAERLEDLPDELQKVYAPEELAVGMGQDLAVLIGRLIQVGEYIAAQA